MKLYIPFILFFLVYLTSCNKNKETLTIYNQNVYIEMWKKNKAINVKIVDTSCINQTKRAKFDIKKGKLIYFDNELRYESKEMAKLLKNYNIEISDYNSSCIGPPPGFENYCYQKVMWNEIDSKLGRKTLDSLWEVALISYVLKNPNKEYIIDIRTKHLN